VETVFVDLLVLRGRKEFRVFRGMMVQLDLLDRLEEQFTLGTDRLDQVYWQTMAICT
jgi:hypothetical protein